MNKLPSPMLINAQLTGIGLYTAHFAINQLLKTKAKFIATIINPG